MRSITQLNVVLTDNISKSLSFYLTNYTKINTKYCKK